MKRRIVPYIFILLPLLSFAQKSDPVAADSLRNELSKPISDSARVVLLNSITKTYRDIDPQKGIAYGMSALKLLEEMDWEHGEAMTCNEVGLCYLNLSDYPDALSYFFKSLSLYKNMTTEQVGTINKKTMVQIGSINENIGKVYFRQGKYPKTLEYYYKALKIYNNTNDTGSIAQLSANISVVYFVQEDYDQAEQYARTSLQLSEQLEDIRGEARSIEIIALIYTDTKRFSEALENAFRSLEMHRLLNDKNDIGINLGNIGGIYLAIAKSDRTTVYTYKGGRLTKRLALNRAIHYLEKAIDVIKETKNLNPLQSFFKDLSEAQELSGQHTDALSSYKMHASLKDSVFSQQNTEEISALETKREIELKDKQIQINELELTKKRNENLFFIVLTLMSITLVFFIFHERKKTEKLLLNILPQKIVSRLKKKEKPIADYLGNVSVMFIDMVGFTSYTSRYNPQNTVSMLNDIFSNFDTVTEKYGLEKIKTIGDCYMAVAGAPEQKANHAEMAANMALEIKEIMQGYTALTGEEIKVRIGLDCGPVVAGVIGQKKFSYDLWGDTVNTASRMESSGIPNEIHCTDNFKNTLKGQNYKFTYRGSLDIKGKGVMKTWVLSE